MVQCLDFLQKIMAKIDTSFIDSLDTRLLNPDEQALNEENEKGRVDRAEISALSEIDKTDGSGLGDVLEDFGKDSPKEYVATVQDRLFGRNGILSRTFENQETSIDRAGIMGNTEYLLIANSKAGVRASADVRASIEGTGRAAETSILGCELMEQSLFEAKSKIENDLDKERNRLEEIKDQKYKFSEALRSKWTKGGALAVGVLGAAATVASGGVLALGAGAFGAGLLGASKGADKMHGQTKITSRREAYYLEKKMDKFETAMYERYEAIEKRLTKAKEDAQARKRLMEMRVQRAFDSTRDLDQQNILWEAVKNVATWGGDNLGFDVTAFSSFVTNDQQKLDFLEAIRSIDWVRDGIGAHGASKENTTRNDEIIKTAQSQQDFLSDHNNFRFQGILQDPDFAKIPKLSEGIDTQELVDSLESDFAARGTNVESLYEAKYKKGGILKPTVRLAILLKSRAIPDLYKILSASSARKLKTWIVQKDEETLGGEGHGFVENANAIGQEFESLQKSNGILNKAHEFLEHVQDEYKKDLEGQDWSTSIKKLSEFGRESATQYTSYKIVRDSLPTETKARLDELWEKVNKAYQEMSTWLGKRNVQQAKYKKAYDTWKKESEEESGTLASLIANAEIEKSGVGTSKSDVQRLKQLDGDIARNKKSLESLSEKESSLSDNFEPIPAELDAWFGYFKSSQKVKFKENLKDRKPKPLNQRIKRQLLDDFASETEQDFLKEMEKNDSYHLLEKVREGVMVNVTYQECGGISHVNFPKELNGSKHSCRVTKKTEKGIWLEDTMNGKAIFIGTKCITGESGKREVKANGVVTDKESRPMSPSSITSSSGRTTMLPNEPRGSDPDVVSKGIPIIAYNIDIV